MTHEVKYWDGDPFTKTGDTMLALLSECQVLTVDISDDGLFWLTEGCDQYFAVGLTPKQLLVLADELREIALKWSE